MAYEDGFSMADESSQERHGSSRNEHRISGMGARTWLTRAE